VAADAVRAALYYGNRDLRLEEVAEPELQRDEVLLRVQVAGICGTDVHEYYDGPIFTRPEKPHPLTGVKNPVILGHEFCGEVVAVGGDAADVPLGALAVANPLETCGRCANCLAGESNLCPLRAAHGLTRSGGAFSELTTVKRSMVHVLPDGVTVEQGALAEPMAVALRAVLRTGAERGQIVAVHGAGPIGIGVLLALRARGIEAIASDPSAVRRRALDALGFERVLDPHETDVAAAIRELTGGRGADHSVDAAGVPAALDAAIKSTAADGTVMMVAVPLQPVQLPRRFFAQAELRLTSSTGVRDEFPETISSIARGDYPLEGWVTTIALDGLIDEGFEPLHRQEKVKVLVDLRSNGAAATRS
jgi:(R,R)-butanediol dehydrogenase/meso-butanediol dehydrogenase/diacetyl reductase